MSTLDNHPYLVSIEYHNAPPFNHFCDTKDKAETIMMLIVSAVEQNRHIIIITEHLYVSCDNVRTVRVIEKGTAMTDTQWLS